MHKIVDEDGDTQWLSASDVRMCSVCGTSISKEQGSICDACAEEEKLDSPDSMFDYEDAFEFLDDDDRERNPLTSQILSELLASDFKTSHWHTSVIVFNPKTNKHEIWYVYSDNGDEQTMHCTG